MRALTVDKEGRTVARGMEAEEFLWYLEKHDLIADPNMGGMSIHDYHPIRERWLELHAKMRTGGNAEQKS
jgi:hypothetical protein